MGVLSGASTEGLTQLMKQYLSEGVPVDGLGIQGHSKPYIKPDPTMIWNLMSSPRNDVERADWLEDAYRAFFAHPSLSGVVMWGFWDLDRRESENKDLVRGVNLTILEPGQRYICLVKKEWTTNLRRNLGEGLAFQFRGFRGDYDVVVRRNGVPVQKESFVLSNNDTAIIIRITNSTVQVTVEEERDYVPRCVSHRGQVSLGQQISVANNQQLTCHTVTSESSGEHEGDEVAVSCPVDEAKLNKRQGEKLEMKDGVLQCKAYNGGNSSAGVRAQARCCRLSGLTCEYRVAGPSLPFEGAQAEATCPSNTQPFGHLSSTGCSSHSRYPDMDGTYQDVNASSCVAQSGHPALADPAARSGSVVFASCCSGPSLNCIRVTSQETGLVRGDQQQVTCPSSYVMVSCAYFAPNGKSGGASIVRDVIGKGVLRGIMGASMNTGSSGVTATATCCKMYLHSLIFRRSKHDTICISVDLDSDGLPSGVKFPHDTIKAEEKRVIS
ncbi:hypothetical protein C0Q70_19987 [Pomacea canaliculata]|uniref:Proprotein convertase subtilisin/kexin type 9 C-terminal domain-containing protein n=1 Tax=Pomacea canaliculata TaxID=400727 RepID=A0A2T7NE94_POMCA|nr:hypothetical protein C0Q70_19987 [Pomacea canaliculata]